MLDSNKYIRLKLLKQIKVVIQKANTHDPLKNIFDRKKKYFSLQKKYFYRQKNPKKKLNPLQFFVFDRKKNGVGASIRIG